MKLIYNVKNKEASDWPQQALTEMAASTLQMDEWIYTYRPDARDAHGGVPSLSHAFQSGARQAGANSSNANAGSGATNADGTPSVLFASVESELMPGEKKYSGSMGIPYFGGRSITHSTNANENQQWLGSVVKM